MEKKSTIKKTIKFDEFMLALKYFMRNKGIAHVSGICDAELLKKNMTEEELSAIFFRALKHNVFVKQESEVHINFELYRLLNAYSSSEAVVTIQNPVYKGQKAVSFARLDHLWVVISQDAKKNEVTLLADENLDVLYDLIAPEWKIKEKNKAFQPKKINKQLEKRNVEVRFLTDDVYQFIMIGVEQRTGKQLQDAILFHVGKKSFDMLTGEVEKNQLENFPPEDLDEKVKCNLERMTRKPQMRASGDGDPDEQTENRERKQPTVEEEPYTRFSFQRLQANENFPHGLLPLLKIQIKNWLKQLTDWKRWVKLVVVQLVFALLVLLWNMYGMCYLNDTFHLASNGFLGSATAYLFGGTAGKGNDLKGLSFITRNFNTALLSGSFYCLLGIWFRGVTGAVMHGKVVESFDNILRFPRRITQYKQSAGKSIGQHIWMGIMIAAPIGFAVWNPFTVFLLALLLLLSCIKADNSSIAVPVMLFRSASGYRKIMEGRKKRPLFADVELRLLGVSVGLFVYSAVNALIWFLFDYNVWVRLLFTVLLILLALFRLGIIKINKPQAVAACLMLLFVCSVLVILSNQGIIVYADDGGWTESGGTLAGLLTNAGFATILGLSALMAVTTLGGSLVVAGIIAGIIAGGSFVWSNTTETGRKTAADFLLGDYSPYGGDSLIAAGLNFAVGLVPGIGDVWGLVSTARDAEYAFSNGDVITGLFDVVCVIGAMDDLEKGLKLAADGMTTAVEKEVYKKILKEEILENAIESGQIMDPELLDKLGAGQLAKEMVNGIYANQTDQISKAMIDKIDIAESLKQMEEGDIAGKMDQVLDAVEHKMNEVNRTGSNSGSSADTTMSSTSSVTAASSNDGKLSHKPTPAVDTYEIFDHLTDEEIRTTVEQMVEIFEENQQPLPLTMKKIVEYLDNKGEGEIDRELLKAIMEQTHHGSGRRRS